MPYVYPPGLNGGSIPGTGGTADEILTATGQSVQEKLDEIENELEILQKEKYVIEFIEDKK